MAYTLRHHYWRMLVCLASSTERLDYIDYFAVSLRLIGALALILTSCGLAAINAMISGTSPPAG
ncbi:MAG: hypothetical protein ACLTXH_06950 [Enterobacter hormaechei]